MLLPGLDGTGTLFEPLLDSMGSEAATTVVDYASPEVSRYADCRAVAERKLPHDEPYVLVGESFSGPIAVSIAAAHPPGLCGVVLVGSFIANPRLALKWLSAFIPVLPRHHAPDWVGDFLLLGRHATPELRARVREAMTGVTPNAVRARLREIVQVNVANELSAINVPLLYLRAVEDRLVPRTCADEIARLSRRARIADVRAPHMLLQCAPAECARLILDFARDCQGARAP